MNEDVDRKRVRREITADELVALIKAANAGGMVDRCPLPGAERAICYLLAVGTGLRASELASLTPLSFELDGDEPTVAVKAAYSKHRRDDVQPLPSQLIDTLRTWLADRPADERLFPRLGDYSYAMIRSDLAAAGINPYNGSGQVLDFHALRTSFGSAIVAGEASPAVFGKLARHSSPTTTLKHYARTRLHDVQGERWPRFRCPLPTPQRP